MIRNLASGRQGFTSNVFLVGGERPALVDVGNEFDVVSALRETGVDPAVVVLTHTHYDHVGNLADVRAALEVPVRAFDPEFEGVDERLADGDSVQLGDHEYVALHTPGHKDDHLCLYAAEPGVVFAGDLVFANGGFGRTDLEEGDRARLIDSIDRVLSTVDEGIAELHAGHGPSVTTEPYRHIEMAAEAARI